MHQGKTHCGLCRRWQALDSCWQADFKAKVSGPCMTGRLLMLLVDSELLALKSLSEWNCEMAGHLADHCLWGQFDLLELGLVVCGSPSPERRWTSEGDAERRQT